ncbi:hypothetical protein DRQ05_00530 [bacterium]|nr:MAG: hypothetical protein DRQ05_00530 [bacterium]
MKRKMFAVALAAGMLLFTVSAFAAGPMNPDMNWLNLNEDQKAKIAELKVNHQMDVVEPRAKVKKLNLMLRQELMKAEPSRKNIDSILGKIGDVKALLAKKKIDHLFELKKVLTPEQWKKLVSRMPMERMGEMHKRMMRRGMMGKCMGKGMMGGGMSRGKRPCPRMNRMQ